MNMADPEALFIARSFEMRDGDALFAATAPPTEIRKLRRLFSSVAVPIEAMTSLAGVTRSQQRRGG